MEATLLATKLFIPPVRPGTVTRPRLLKRLDGILGNSLTLVSAPAGFGKTTLLAHWIQNSGVLAAWLSVDEGENDPRRFWAYLIAAMNMLKPGTGVVSPAPVRSPERVPAEHFMTALINELATIPVDFVFVLDDYHVIESETIHRGIAFLLDHLPPKMHLVIGTRADPPLPLARLRGKGTLLETRVDDLRFTSDEAVSLLSSLGSPGVSRADVTTLNAWADGWVAGLKMAVLSMRGQSDVAAFISGLTGAQRYIMDYLFEEVLQRQPKGVRDFLLKTSILQRLNGPLCDAVTGSSGGQETLLALEKANLFVAPLDASMEWYRYHHLFVDLLRHRLRTELVDSQVSELHARASQWFESRGLPEDAIHHALEARSWERALEIISRPDVLRQAQRSETMFNWLRRIPDERLRKDVRLYLSYVWALEAVGRYDDAEDCLNYLDGISETEEGIRGSIAVARANIAADRGDWDDTEKHAIRALSVLSPDQVARRGMVSGLLGGVYAKQLRVVEAEPLFIQTVEALRKTGTEVVPLTMLGWITYLKGRVHRAEAMFQEAIKAAEEDPVAFAITHVCAAHLRLGGLYYQLNDLDRAAFHEERAIELYRPSGTMPWSMQLDVAYLELAQTRVAQGDIDAAMEAMKTADRLLSERNADPVSRGRNAAFHAQIAFIQGDPESASRWAEISQENDDPMRPDQRPRLLYLLLAKKNRASEEQRLKDLYDKFAPQGLQTVLIEARVLQSLLSTDTDIAVDLLGEALMMGRPEGVVRVFADCRMQLAPLLRLAISRGIEPEYARKLLGIIESEDRQRRIRKGELPASTSATGPLSCRELEVLRLVADGLSNQQIARRLNISLSTAKTHVYHIFDKLGAKDRLQVVTKARELKLL